MAEKQTRVAALAKRIAPALAADPEQAERAGTLCKCDLVTSMVTEFPKLQGHMGTLYAEAQGEDPAVAKALEEMYLPAFADDSPAATPVGIALAVADRLDTLAGCFAIGLVPKGGDPQGLRRAALGVVRTFALREIHTDLNALFTEAIEHFHASVLARPEGFEAWTKHRGSGPAAAYAEKVAKELTDFTLARFRAWAISEGASADVVDAVLSASVPDPVVLARKASALKGIAGQPDFKAIMVTFKRVLNITRDADYPPPSDDQFTHPAEKALSEVADRVEGQVSAAVAALKFEEALDHMLALRQPVAALFDAVMVDSNNPEEKAVRMGLLLRVGKTFLELADFTRISTR
jgi:glycyl-tRNA synthetase beta chain